MDSALNVRGLLEDDKDYGDSPITSFDDKRLNPFRSQYNPDVAWDFFNPMTTRGPHPVLVDDTRRNAFMLWRFTYCEPNNPRCDRCAIYMNQGCFPGRVREPPYPDGPGIEACNTGGDTTCRPCDAAGAPCTVYSVSADSGAVREYVRGRGFHWYEGVGQRPCDVCLARADPNCRFWQQGGCAVCRKAGVNCLINGHKPGSFAERISRRQGYEHRISGVICDKLGMSRRDEAYLLDRLVFRKYGFSMPSMVPLPRAPPAIPSVDPNSGYFATVEQAETALKQMGIHGPPNSTMSSLAPMSSATCEHCFRNKTPCTGDGPENTCSRCTMHEHECVWPSQPSQGPISLVDRHGPVHICLGCQNGVDWDDCDAELPRHELAEGHGCTNCRRRGQRCQIRPDEHGDGGNNIRKDAATDNSSSSSGSKNDSGQGAAAVVITLAPRPDGLTAPLCCDHCLEDPLAGINGCSFRIDYRGAQEPHAPCRRCATRGRLCTIGGYYFFGEAAPRPETAGGGGGGGVTTTPPPPPPPPPQQQPSSFASHLGTARPTHLFLTKRRDHTVNGDAQRPFGAREPQGHPREDGAVRIPGSRDVCWGRAARGAEPANRNVGLYMPGGPLTPLPELWRYGDDEERPVDTGGV